MTSLEAIAALVRRESGIRIDRPQFPSLSAAIDRAAPGLGPDGVLAAVARPNQRDGLLERLIDEVAVKETYFFRHERELAAIEWRTQLDASQKAGRAGLRVWSAACATGEEAYTLAIMACEALGTPAPPVSILGTDISHGALEHAHRAEYGRRSLREVAGSRVERWFAAAGRELTVADEPRKMVQLRRHNMVRDPIPPSGEDKFDVIVCRNVLIYFDRATVHRTLTALERAIYPEGLLVIGAADRLSGPIATFAAQPQVSRRLDGAATGRQAASGRPAAMSGKRAAATGRRAALSGARAKRSAPATAALATAAPANARGTSSLVGNVQEALHAVHEWSLEKTVQRTGALLERDPLNAAAYFVRGVAQLAAGDPADAVASLRRALYLDPDFALAAFKLARAYDALHDPNAARRAYLRALHSLRPDDPHSAALLDQLDVADIAVACKTRLAVLDGR